MSKIYAQYGCGLSAPEAWLNFDASPTLRLQKNIIAKKLLKPLLKVKFPENVLYGDIVKGLPLSENSCAGLYCSHILEHLALYDFREALKNSYKILAPNGVFRCVVPDLEWAAREYIRSLDDGKSTAALEFIGKATLLGLEKRPNSIKEQIISYFGNSHHLWMWDYASLSAELANAGFKYIRPCQYNDNPDQMFALVENKDRFVNAVAIECKK